MKALALRWRGAAGVLAVACVAGSAAAAPPDNHPARARLNFIQYCIGCHSADGSGAPAKGVPSMRDALGQFLQVPGGREFIVQVPGVMNSPLNDRDIAELTNWLLQQVSPSTTPADTPPYTADEIARLRQTRPVDVMAKRRELVARMRDAGIAVEAQASR